MPAHTLLKCSQLCRPAAPQLPVAIRSPLEPSLILLSFTFRNQWMTSHWWRGAVTLQTISGVGLRWLVSSELLTAGGVGILRWEQKFSKIDSNSRLPSEWVKFSPDTPPVLLSYITLLFCFLSCPLLYGTVVCLTWTGGNLSETFFGCLLWIKVQERWANELADVYWASPWAVLCWQLGRVQRIL